MRKLLNFAKSALGSLPGVLLALGLTLMLTACGGLPHAGQISAKATTIGLSAGTDPASGGFSATMGYKNASAIYNPGTTGPEDKAGNGAALISGDRDGQADARAVLQWDHANAGAGSGNGVALNFGSGVGTGWAARIMACGFAAAAGGSAQECASPK